MQALTGHVIFEVGGSPYRWEHVVLCAQRLGHWAGVERSAREGLAAELALTERGESLPSAQVQAAVREFRSRRRLYSGRETADWLDERLLSAADLTAYVRRVLLRDRPSGKVERTLAPEQLAGVLRAEAICSGAIGAAAGELAELAAVRCTMALAGTPPAEQSVPSADERGLAELMQLQPEDLGPVLARLAADEAGFAGFKAQVLTEDALAAELETAAADWLRIDCDSASFPREPAAREAALCVRHEGADLTEVATEAGAPTWRALIYMDELEPPIRKALLSARPGELVGPLEHGGEHHLVLVHEKSRPTLADSGARARAANRLLERALNRAAAESVRWHVHL